MKKDKKVMIMIILVFLLLVLDQALKIYCIRYKNIEAQEILPGVRLTYEESNKGAFGLGQNSVITYVISTTVVLGIVLKFFLTQKERINMGIVVGISLLFAGGLSNMIDKIFHGNVVNCLQVFQLPTINLSFLLIAIAWIELAAIFAFTIGKEMRLKNA